MKKSEDVIGIVRGTNGMVLATDRKGNIRVLTDGDRVYANEVVEARNGAAVHLEFTGGGFEDVSCDESFVITPSVFANALAVKRYS